MASNISTQIGVANPKVTVTNILGTNPVKVVGDSQYIPVTIDLSPSDIVASVIPIATQSKLKAEVSGAFDNVRVGDFISSIATGSLTAKSNISVTDAYLASGLKEIAYNETYNSGNLGVKSGDLISVAAAGTGIPSNTTVLKIDYDNRKIYIDKAITETKIADLTITPKIRVTAVRKSTSVSNPNEIDFDSTVATTGVAGNVTIKGGAVDSVLTVISLTPLDDEVDSKATLSVNAANLDGSEVKGSPEGFNGLNYATLNYANLGRYQTDLKTFRTKARVEPPSAS